MKTTAKSQLESLFNQSFDVKEIIDKACLDTNEVAKHLFPTNKYPLLALIRVLDGLAFLDSNQIQKLASLANITVAEMFDGQWKQASKDNIITFTSSTYRAELDTTTWITKIFDNDSLFHESVLNSGSTVLSEYIQGLNLIINNHKQKTS